RRLGYRILCAALVVGLFGWWPLPIGNQGGYDPKAQLLPHGLLLLAPNRGNRATVEFTWRGLDLIVGNYYVLTLLVFIAATACARAASPRRRPERAVGPEPDAVWAAHARPASPGRGDQLPERKALAAIADLHGSDERQQELAGRKHRLVSLGPRKTSRFTLTKEFLVGHWRQSGQAASVEVPPAHQDLGGFAVVGGHGEGVGNDEDAEAPGEGG